MNGNEYATKAFKEFCDRRSGNLAEDLVQWLREAFGTGFAFGIAFAKAIPTTIEEV